MIINRPKELFEIEFYEYLPTLPLRVDYSLFPELLKIDIWDLCGLLPVTKHIPELYPNGIFGVQPSSDVINYYKKNKVNFVMITVVVNCCVFKLDNGVISGYPYSISLVPATKRGHLDYVDVEFASRFNLENMPIVDSFVYTDFNPFTGNWGLFGKYGLFFSDDGFRMCHTDMLGFVKGVYFLADSYNKEEVILIGFSDAPKHISKKYRNIRINRYFKPFSTLMPRRIWGVDSPIELFLMQSMINKGLSPIPQLLVFNDGSVYPSLHDICQDIDFSSDSNLITEADFYFPGSNLLIFCDSTQYHRSARAKEKDTKIDASLKNLGFNVLRINGDIIVNNLANAVGAVIDALSKI